MRASREATARTGDIPALTGVRGVAALGVMAFHYWFRDWVSPDTVGGAACARGYIFVDLFFLLSGFVMAKSYGARFAHDFDFGTYARFLRVRSARIYPVYLVLVTCGVAVAFVHPNGSPHAGPVGILANLTLTQTWFGIAPVILTSWSLSTEWAAYLVFPALAAAFLGGRPVAAVLGALAAFAAVAALWGFDVAHGRQAVHGLDNTDGTIGPMVRCLGGFVLGMCLHRLRDRAELQAAGGDAVGAAVLALLAALWMTRGMPDLAVYACLPALLLCLALNTGRVAAAFGGRAMVLLGEWSYSIYLVHIFFIRERERMYRVFAEHLPSPAADALGAAVFFGVTIAVSAALYTWLEVPARDWIRGRLHERRLPIELEPSAP